LSVKFPFANSFVYEANRTVNASSPTTLKRIAELKIPVFSVLDYGRRHFAGRFARAQKCADYVDGYELVLGRCARAV